MAILCAGTGKNVGRCAWKVRHERSRWDKSVEVRVGRITPGDRVRIHSGAYDGREGTFRGQHRNGRLLVSVNLSSYAQTASWFQHGSRYEFAAEGAWFLQTGKLLWPFF